MQITAIKLTDDNLMRRACESTMRGQTSKMTLDKIYRSEHSPTRVMMFWIEMKDIPTFVSVHLVRHGIGVEHFVMSNREDRGGNGTENRYTPVNHSMLANAQALINMARKRLCGAASKETQEVMQCIKDAIGIVDPDLAKYMVRECEYRNGICPESKPCSKLYINDDARRLKVIEKETAMSCAEIAASCPPEITMFGDCRRCIVPRAISGVIRKEFNV